MGVKKALHFWLNFIGDEEHSGEELTTIPIGRIRCKVSLGHVVQRDTS